MSQGGNVGCYLNDYTKYKFEYLCEKLGKCKNELLKEIIEAFINDNISTHQ
jgi:predicted DNA-binding protein